jgi:hypothetical protein
MYFSPFFAAYGLMPATGEMDCSFSFFFLAGMLQLLQ